MDYDSKEITLYGQSVSNAPIPGSSKNYTGWIVAGAVVGAIIVAIIILCLCKKCKRNRYNTEGGYYVAQGVRVGGRE